MNNLDIIQEAAIGSPHMAQDSHRDTMTFDFGAGVVMVYPPLGHYPHWEVHVAGATIVSFPDMATAFDWLCDHINRKH